ncbi:tegument protein UL7 [Ateline alphaherpesvirus 1]|uniref:Tegument protein UL7 n=1 Tax=Herpesvirus ateles type 1 (strain Lennette) TaxID=35243 RepID=A0A1S6JLQ3_HSVA1|nr:tegument protein UL7 [Ateline alphaherpesvirus 1]AQS79209.1 tegument protein UL7 [Ateline alphaherpesvirus 1]
MAAPSPRDSGETALATLRRAVSHGPDLAGVAETVGDQTLLRLACEVRQVAGHAPRISATAIARLNVSPGGQLSFVLEGAPADQETPSPEYHRQCLDQPAYRGLVCAAITAAEDRVDSLGVQPPTLQHRLVLLRPAALADFELLAALMFLENCPPALATPGLFVRVSAWLGRVARRTSPLQRLRRLLLRSCRWVLNTLMFMTNVDPFSDALVLPHWYMARCLLSSGAPPPVVAALFDTPPGPGPDPGPAAETDCVAYSPDGVMGRPWRSEAFRRALVSWWTSPVAKTRDPDLFVDFE